MGLALHEATHALASDDVPVGALVVSPDGRLLGVGRNRREESGDPTAHAEVLALRQAAGSWGRWPLEGGTLVVTLEPCVMCAGALVAARVDRLVVGAWDPKAGATGSVRVALAGSLRCGGGTHRLDLADSAPVGAERLASVVAAHQAALDAVTRQLLAQLRERCPATAEAAS